MPLTQVREEGLSVSRAFVFCVSGCWQLSVKGGGQSSCPVVSVWSVAVCRTTELQKFNSSPPTGAVSESDCPSLDSHWTPLSYLTVYRPGSAIFKQTHTYIDARCCNYTHGKYLVWLGVKAEQRWTQRRRKRGRQTGWQRDESLFVCVSISFKPLKTLVLSSHFNQAGHRVMTTKR